jgi:ribonuclease VapC
MIVDTSAVVAILSSELEKDRFTALLLASTSNRMASGSWVELAAVNTRRFRGELGAEIEALMTEFDITVEPMTFRQAQIGHAAYRKYGLGTRHPARLNFGDCFAYALAIDTGQPLLFKGDDFIHTDVKRAI